jgi:sulfate adenylyltransferase subunit 2
VLRRPDESRNAHQSVTLLDAIAELGFDACIGGARRDEEKSRAKERIVSFRDAFGQWDPKQQRPELWNLYNARVGRASTCACSRSATGPSSTCGATSRAKTLEVPSLVPGPSARGRAPGGALVPVTPLTPARDGETVESVSVRFRTVGDITCTAPVRSTAATLEAIVAETALGDR